MNEFSNRIEAQRNVLQRVNNVLWPSEELFGLSARAIDRWVSANRIDPDGRLVSLVKTAAEKLFFLANKSQEQISSEYQSVSNDISSIAETISLELEHRRAEK